MLSFALAIKNDWRAMRERVPGGRNWLSQLASVSALIVLIASGACVSFHDERDALALDHSASSADSLRETCGGMPPSLVSVRKAYRAGMVCFIADICKRSDDMKFARSEAYEAIFISLYSKEAGIDLPDSLGQLASANRTSREKDVFLESDMYYIVADDSDEEWLMSVESMTGNYAIWSIYEIPNIRSADGRRLYSIRLNDNAYYGTVHKPWW
jgi:hypothetical protein